MSDEVASAGRPADRGRKCQAQFKTDPEIAFNFDPPASPIPRERLSCRAFRSGVGVSLRENGKMGTLDQAGRHGLRGLFIRFRKSLAGEADHSQKKSALAVPDPAGSARHVFHRAGACRQKSAANSSRSVSLRNSRNFNWKSGSPIHDPAIIRYAFVERFDLVAEDHEIPCA